MEHKFSGNARFCPEAVLRASPMTTMVVVTPLQHWRSQLTSRGAPAASIWVM